MSSVRPDLRTRHYAPLLLVLLAAALLRLPLLDLPFGRNSEGIGVYYGVMARNYLEHGLFQTWLVPIQSVGDNDTDPPTLYPNHPPLVPLTIALVYKLLGVGEWQTRLPFVLFTLGATAMLYHLTLRASTGPTAKAVDLEMDQRPPTVDPALERASSLTASKPTGFSRGTATLLATLAATLFAFTPIALRYGGSPDVINAQLVCFALLTIAAYLRLHARPSPRTLALLCLAFLPAALTDWPAFYLVPVLCAHFAVTRRPREWHWPVAFGLFATLVFAGMYAHISLVTGDWQLILNQFLRRSTSAADDAKNPFTWSSWFTDAVVGHNVLSHTWPLVIVGTVGAIDAVALRRPSAVRTLARILLAFAALHVLVGRQGVLVHDWWWWPLTPAVCVCAALVAARVLDLAGMHRPSARVAAVVLTLTLALAFASYTTYANFSWFLSPQTLLGQNPHYAPDDLGRAIRHVSRPNEAVLVVDADPYPYVWFYADRPIKMQVWGVEDLRDRLADDRADLSFGYTQSWTPRPTALVLPRIFAVRFHDLLTHLQQNHRPIEPPPDLAEQFLLFDLRP